MSHVAWLELRDFRNLTSGVFHPSGDGLTVVTGANGSGKTSLLEAIGYAATLKSFRGSPKVALVRNGCSEAVLRLEVKTSSRTSLVEAQINPDGRDVVQVNRQRVTRVQQLVEVLRTTVFTPDDLDLVKGGPHGRREFLDDVLVACFPKLSALRQSVERVLRQRGTLLRQAGGRGSPEILATLDVWDEQLAALGEDLVRQRLRLVDALTQPVDLAFNDLTGLNQAVHLRYRRSEECDLATALTQHRAEDLRRGVSTVGPHRDDLVIEVGGLDARTRLSQGQQRGVTLALRLGSHGLVREETGFSPVLLLDDAFSELDERTARALFRQLPPGQAILTTAGPLPPDAEVATVVELRDGTLGP